MTAPAGHLLTLPGGRWWIWREAVLRSTGFPTARILDLGDPELLAAARATAASRLPMDEFARRYRAAAGRSSDALRAIAADPRFREAVTWQNPEVARNWLGSFAAPGAGPAKRKHVLPIARYAQRYLVKNETIGFFGPVCWARWGDGDDALRLHPGERLLAGRSLYFEVWAIDALADALAGDPDIQPWLAPRLVASCLLEGARLLRPYRDPLTLTPAQADLLRRCDGSRPVRELAAGAGRDSVWSDPATLLAQLHAWREDGVIHIDLRGPVEARPERTLRRKLLRIGDPEPRRRALRALAELESRREEVAAAAGDPEALARALESLGGTFARATAIPHTRRPGPAGSGRTVVYEDARRAVEVELGRPLLAAVAPPLALVLDSARWFVARAAANLDARTVDLFRRCQDRTGHCEVPLPALLAMLTPDLHPAPDGSDPVSIATAELQRRWARILRLPAGVSRHQVAVAAIEDEVRALFPASPPAWAGAICYSPDLLIAAAGPGAVNQGRFQAVLGELHAATNTLESRPFVEQHPDPARLLRAAEADYRGRRIYSVPTKEWPQVNSRTYPSALLSPSYTYWCLHADTGGAPGPVLPAAGLVVEQSRGGLVVRYLPDGRTRPLPEVLGEQLSFAVVNGFRLLPAAPHQPRITFDQLVVHRESWTEPAGNLRWAAATEPHLRFHGAQAWREVAGLPQRAFYKISGERKPTYVDFSSAALVECLAHAVSRAAAGDGRTVAFTEALPDPTETWLRDRDGAGYSAELRMVAVDPCADDG